MRLQESVPDDAILYYLEWNKTWSPPFSCCPVSCQCPRKKTLIEKKKQFKVSLKVTAEGSFSNDINARHHTYKFTKKYLARQSNPIQETYLWIFAAKKASITHYFKSVKSCFTV